MAHHCTCILCCIKAHVSLVASQTIHIRNEHQITINNLAMHSQYIIFLRGIDQWQCNPNQILLQHSRMSSFNYLCPRDAAHILSNRCDNNQSQEFRLPSIYQYIDAYYHQNVTLYHQVQFVHVSIFLYFNIKIVL